MTILADNNTSVTPVDPAVLAWVQELAAIRERTLNDRIVSLDDPRAQQIANDYAPAGADVSRYFGDPDKFLEEIYWQHFAEKPVCPQPLPEWASTQQAYFGAWPEIEVTYATTIDLDKLGITLSVSGVETIFGEDVTDDDGTTHPTATISPDTSPQFVIHGERESVSIDYTDTDTLRVISAAILGLARQIDDAPAPLTRHAEAGQPAFEEVL